MNRINFRKIAEELNVSHMTLYRVINNAQDVKSTTRARVVDALNRHGYYQNARLRPQTIIFDIVENARSDYMRNIMTTLMGRLSVHAFQCIVTSHTTDRQRFLLAVRDAQIVVFAPMKDRAIYDEAKDVNPDLLILNLLDDTVGDIAIASDDFQGGELAARYFYNHGHRNHVAVMLPRPEDGPQHSFHNRYKGFLAEMLTLSPKCRIDILEESLAPAGDCRSRLPSFFRRRKHYPSAVFCPGRYFADKLYRYCERHDIAIPHELSLLGYDKPGCSEDPSMPAYDRVVFDPEQIISWAEFFIMNRPVMKNRCPVHLLLDMKIEKHQTTKTIEGDPK